LTIPPRQNFKFTYFCSLMRLKTLEIKGFKSFASDTAIHFQEDVIGIVGPNGSGKSNIVDAIRWVLGEQKSSELRLDQMTSVIFNGSKSRKPGNVASVSLTFENTRNLLPTEYHTVTITRMLYRTGESEYRLNNVACRLKDITTLLLDTGIGSNSYAIIALGMVDDILNDKDNSRRRMFEQAAGISKYKARKKETLSKLESATADLDRIEDLLFEIDNNLKTLEKQAKRTRRYFEMREEYKHASTELALVKMNVLKTRYNSFQKQLTREEDAYRALEIEVHRLEAQLEREKKANIDKEKVLSERQKDLNELVGQIRSLEGDVRMHDQRLQFAQNSEVKLREEIRAAETRKAQFLEDIAHYRTELNAEKRVESRLQLELETAEQNLVQIRQSHGTIKTQLDEIIRQQQAIEREIFELEKQKAISQNHFQNIQAEVARNSQAIVERSIEVNALQEKINALETAEASRSNLVLDLEKAEEERKATLHEAETELDEITQKLTRLNRELDAKRNEFKLTQSMIENLEGFPESIRFLSSSKEWIKETPLLSDIIYVKEEFRVAIENFLEPYLNYYVVSNVDEAFQAIQLLSKSQKGKANFFILDAFKTYTTPLIILPETLRALDLVETDPAYRNLCDYLLERVLIAEKDDLKPTSLEEGTILLSRTGNFIHRGYSVSGGSVGLFEGKRIGRKKNLELLQTSIKRLETESSKLSTAFAACKGKIEQLKAAQGITRIQQERQALHQLVQQKVSLVTRLESFETFIRSGDAQNEASQVKIEALQKAVSEMDIALSNRKMSLAEAMLKISGADSSYSAAAEQLSQASAAFNEKNIQFIRQQNKVASLQREMIFREKQLEEAVAQQESNAKKLAEIHTDILRAQNAIDQSRQNLSGALDSRKGKEGTLTEAEQSYFQTRSEINTLEEQLRKVSRQRQEAQILINTLKDKFAEVKFEISGLAQRLRIEFEIDINELLLTSKASDTPIEELELRTERLKGRLDNYGEINPMAVEAYDEMKERYDTISVQRDDVVKAKTALLQTIQEIEETATSQFLDSFSKVRLSFIDVFRSLFTEDDTCDLILVDPNNPLDSKIEIVARPKGKKPQTISQLSGGEKTLTATALLFALYLLKPAPFCIFDEVDAPLDDTNISKFNKIIKKFSKDSQFIIVTHNKLTMAAVDTIYGVYMAEQGVSGVSQVDFRDFDYNPQMIEAETRKEN
jgi:chromosome segregation protein